MTIDLGRARSETPGCENVAHLNNAGAALMPAPVLDATTAHLAREARIGGYEAEAEAEDSVERCYGAAATLLGCAADELAFVENATRAWDMAFYALPLAAGDRILTAVCEYASNYISFLQVARRTGAVVELVPNDASGQLDVAALERMIDGKVKLIAVTHVPTNGGLVNPVAEIGRVARAAGVPYLLDACQSVGQMPIDVAAIGCDMLSFTGRKYLRAPRGTGMLYVRRAMIGRLEPPLLDMRAAEWVAPDRYEIRPDARRFETWESNVAGKIGLGVALDYALGWGLEDIYARIRGLADALRDGLAAIAGVTLRDLGVETCGIVSFTIDDVAPAAAETALRAQGINVSHSTAPGTRIDMDARGLADVIRASLHYYNSEAEVARLVAAVEALARTG